MNYIIRSRFYDMLQRFWSVLILHRNQEPTEGPNFIGHRLTERKDYVWGEKCTLQNSKYIEPTSRIKSSPVKKFVHILSTSTCTGQSKDRPAAFYPS
ncbi:hypothetical protein M758_6G098500 [Ceratodon purpureus]|uniref:Uncharacterized protein n=1 Tax=Ceratodon purpureus TaxID=3225 RepID=A0A8T0HCR0_CERPU|nr:hypothetical protein KC19_6G102200 [Ceratodon purpureus]KAG0613379.1 hypothetical protein M758_6G098500 [Ceratodon purpureus]